MIKMLPGKWKLRYRARGVLISFTSLPIRNRNQERETEKSKKKEIVDEETEKKKLRYKGGLIPAPSWPLFANVAYLPEPRAPGPHSKKRKQKKLARKRKQKNSPLSVCQCCIFAQELLVPTRSGSVLFGIKTSTATCWSGWWCSTRR